MEKRAQNGGRRGAIKLDAAPPRRAVQAGLKLRRGLQRAADRLVPPEVLAYEQAISFFRTRVLGALVELGVIDALAGGSRTAAELATELELDADTLHRVLRMAATFDAVELDGNRFGLTAVGAALSSSHSPTLGPWVRYLNTDAVQAAWAALPDAVRTGEPCFPAVHGASTWDHFATNPEEERQFANAMRELSKLTLAWIVSGYPWPERGVVCDVAGGSGPVLAAILGARPDLTGILVEAAGVLPEAEGHLEEAGVGDRVELREGNMFERIDAEGDVYVLKDILHDYDDERCLQILRVVAGAMPAGSRVVLVETILDRNETDPIGASIDLHMLTQCDGGRQRSVGELQELLRAAGLRPGSANRTGGPGLVEGIAGP